MRGVDQAIRHEEVDAFQAGIDFRGGTGEQQHHAGKEYQHREDRSGQAGRHAHALARRDQTLGLGAQQCQASQQQRQ